MGKGWRSGVTLMTFFQENCEQILTLSLKDANQYYKSHKDMPLLFSDNTGQNSTWYNDYDSFYNDFESLINKDIPIFHVNIGISVKGAILLGVGAEFGITFDSKGGFGAYATLSVGTGVQVGTDFSLEDLLSPTGNFSSGDIGSMSGSSTTIDAGVGLIGTWDINNLNSNGSPNSTGGLSFGGGVWKNYTFVLTIFSGRKY